MPKLPDAVGKYKILDRLGRGGMSVIYKAEHPTLGIPVVLKKLMLKGDAAHRDRFRREATLMMRLRHENVVGVYDHFKDGGGHFLVMEYVDGRPLSELLAREGALPPDEAAWIVGRMALALAHIHSNGIVHRDVKPSNVLIRRDGVVKLADFGIAFSPGSAEDITAEGTALGTPSFMAPEQLEDARCADEKSDMWSLGVCFFELITGRKFVTGPTPAAIRESLPTALRTMSQRLPAKLPWRLKKFLRRTLRMRPKSRLAGGGAAIRLLRAGRRGNRPPPGLQRRLDSLIASMEPIQDPTPLAAASNGGDIPDNPPSGSFQSLLSSLLGPRAGLRDGGGTEELDRNGSVERQVSGLRSALVHRPILAILSLLILMAAAGMLVIPGAWDRLFRPAGHGMVSLRLVFPAEAPDYWIAGAEARVFREESESLSEVANPVLRASDDGLSLKSRRLTLPIGAYRIRWSLGDTVSWTSFRQPSFREIRSHEGEPLVLEEKLGAPPV
ncbi:MAG: serine/threonine-protein kinase, partial [Spirochaetaceae bacterium]|nr:serine/threonine-protein kinase [Spirochaetaceae bacterium]